MIDADATRSTPVRLAATRDALYDAWVRLRDLRSFAVVAVLIGACHRTPDAQQPPGPCDRLRDLQASDDALCLELSRAALLDADGRRSAARSVLEGLAPEAASHDGTRALVAMLRGQWASQRAQAETELTRAFELAVQAGETEIACVSAAETTMSLGPGRLEDTQLWTQRMERFADEAVLSPMATFVVTTARGRTAIDSGETEAGLTFLQDAVDIAARTWGSTSREAAKSWLNLGLAQKKSGQQEEAAHSYAQAIDLLRRSPIDAPRLLASAFEKRGTLRLQRREFELAVSDQQEALRQYARAPGSTERAIADVYLNLGLTHARNGDHDLAIRNYSEAIQRLVDTSVEHDPTMAMALINRGASWRALDALDRAADDYHSALSWLEAIERVDDRYAIGAHVNLAAVRILQGRHDNALETLDRVLALLESSGRSDGPTAAVAQINRCEALQGQGDLQGAKAACSRALEIRLKVLPEGAPGIESARKALLKVSAAQKERKR